MCTKLIIVLLYSMILPSSDCTSKNDVRGNIQNRTFIDQLKKRVLPHIRLESVIHQFRNDDLYWLKWLKANSFKLDKTSRNFLNNLQWRQEEKIDTIHLEDWSYFKSEYPEFHDTVDKTGRPVIEIWFSDWNIRKAVISGRSRQLIRWMIYNLEMGMRKLFLLRSERPTSVSGIIEIVDYAGMNIRTQSCVSCLSIYQALQEAVPQHYPGVLEEVIMVNVATRQGLLLNAWKKTFDTLTATNMSIYGREAEWIPVLNKKVSGDQLSMRFGGTRTRF